MIIHNFNLNTVHSSWFECINEALTLIDPFYLENLSKQNKWLPGNEKIFNAFSLPVDDVKYILLGESPYPRHQSANGYAFWDFAVKELWSTTGLSKTVNRATSLRNIIKMLLIAEGRVPANAPSQENIAKINKSDLVQTNEALFKNFLSHGFLLLNASLVLQPTAVSKDAKAWYPFIQFVINYLLKKHQPIHLMLFGNIANAIDKVIDQPKGLIKVYSEHPYNLSFIQNEIILNFFKPLHLLIDKSLIT